MKPTPSSSTPGRTKNFKPFVFFGGMGASYYMLSHILKVYYSSGFVDYLILGLLGFVILIMVSFLDIIDFGEQEVGN